MVWRNGAIKSWGVETALGFLSLHVSVINWYLEPVALHCHLLQLKSVWRLSWRKSSKTVLKLVLFTTDERMHCDKNFLSVRNCDQRNVSTYQVNLVFIEKKDYKMFFISQVWFFFLKKFWFAFRPGEQKQLSLLDILIAKSNSLQYVSQKAPSWIQGEMHQHIVIAINASYLAFMKLSLQLINAWLV